MLKRSHGLVYLKVWGDKMEQQNIVKKFFGFSIGPVLGAFVSFITVPLTTYYINPTEFGKASMFTLIQSIISMIIYFGLDQSFVNFYYSVKNKMKLLTNSLLIPLILSLVLGLIFILESSNLSIILFDSSNYTDCIYILALSMPLIICERFILLQLRMKEWAVRYSFFNLMIKLVTFIVTCYFVFFVRRDFLAIVYSTLFGQIISDIILLILYRKYIKINLELVDKSLVIKLCKYGFPLVIVSVIGWGLNSMDRVWLKYFSTYEEIGYYTAAMKVCNMLLIVQTCFTTFWTPIAYRWHHEKVSNKNFTIIMRMVSFIMSVIFLIILIGKGLLLIVLSKDYANAIPIFPFLLFYPIMYTVSETTVLGIDFTRKSYLNIRISLYAILTNTVLNTMLIPLFGAIGAAMATGISYIIFFVFRTYYSRENWYKFPINSFFYMIIVLLLNTFVHTFLKSFLFPTVVSMISVLIICVIYKDIIIYFISELRKHKI